jgi:hypothetical protein
VSLFGGRFWFTRQPRKVEASDRDVAVIRFVSSIRAGFIDAVDGLIGCDCEVAISSYAWIDQFFHWPCFPFVVAHSDGQNLAGMKLVCPYSRDAFTVGIGEENAVAIIRRMGAVADDAGCADRFEELVWTSG